MKGPISYSDVYFVDWGLTVSIYKDDNKIELNNDDLKALYRFISNRGIDKICMSQKGSGDMSQEVSE